MNKDLDILQLLRKYECFDNLKKQAADEIERLRAENAKLNSFLYRMKRITQDQTEDYI
jgi:hypothetical protein